MGDEAEAQLAHYSGGHHVPEYGDDLAEAEAFEVDAAMDASSIAHELQGAVAKVLARAEHVCTLADYATTTLHEGATVVLCGCGEFFEASELAAPAVDLAPARVDAHGPAAVTVAAADPIARTLQLIGPAEDYTPEQVERLMLDCVHRLEEGQAFERWALEQASEAQRAYNRAYAKAFTLAGGAMELRRNVAEVECAELADARDRTDMVHRAAKAAMHNLRSTLSGYQSVLKSVQATYQVGGSSGGRPY